MTAVRSPPLPLWARLFPLVFGVYWVHPLILAGTVRLTGAGWTPGQCLLFQLPATLLLSPSGRLAPVPDPRCCGRVLM